jgi:hypothetical protein
MNITIGDLYKTKKENGLLQIVPKEETLLKQKRRTLLQSLWR